MEWQHTIVTKTQNTVSYHALLPLSSPVFVSLIAQAQAANGYGVDGLSVTTPHARLLHLWASFYQVGQPEEQLFYFPSFEEASAQYAREQADISLPKRYTSNPCL
jgi:hypothetical protein